MDNSDVHGLDIYIYNLRVFNCILKKTIREAKIQYYDKLFTQYKGDIKKKPGKLYRILFANQIRNEKY